MAVQTGKYKVPPPPPVPSPKDGIKKGLPMPPVPKVPSPKDGIKEQGQPRTRGVSPPPRYANPGGATMSSLGAQAQEAPGAAFRQADPGGAPGGGDPGADAAPGAEPVAEPKSKTMLYVGIAIAVVVVVVVVVMLMKKKKGK